MSLEQKKNFVYGDRDDDNDEDGSRGDLRYSDFDLCA